MSLTKEITDKKVNFEFNKEFISLFSIKIKENDTIFLNHLKHSKKNHDRQSIFLL